MEDNFEVLLINMGEWAIIGGVLFLILIGGIWVSRSRRTISNSVLHEEDSNIKRTPSFPKITFELQQQLANISPSHDEYGMYYYPCEVELKDGLILENVYFSDIESYLQHWGDLPGEDKARYAVMIEKVATIKESPNRLSVHLANKLYKAGESGMGYCVFKIVYDDGTELDVATGNAVDFVPSPDGLNTANVVDVLPHEGSRDQFVKGPKYYWCLYEI